jgi:hypothetical protein
MNKKLRKSNANIEKFIVFQNKNLQQGTINCFPHVHEGALFYTLLKSKHLRK